MSTLREIIVARLKSTRQGLDKAVGRASQEMMGWAPTAGMRTIAGQLVEIAATEMQILTRLKGDPSVSDDQVREMIGAHQDLERLREFLVQTRHETLAYVASLTDDELAELVRITGWHESIGLSEMPRSEVFVSICQHEAYHVGQLVSYLWARGDDPYRW